MYRESVYIAKSVLLGDLKGQGFTSIWNVQAKTWSGDVGEERYYIHHLAGNYFLIPTPLVCHNNNIFNIYEIQICWYKCEND